jgi:hypothetical protein
MINGFPAENHELVSYTILPNILTVEGPAKVMEKLSILRTQNISIEGRSESFTVPVKIGYVSDLINYIENDQVQFRGRIEKNFVHKTIAPVPINITGENSKLNYRLELTSGIIEAEVERTILDKIDYNNCFLYADVTGITEPGNYKVTVEIVLPQLEKEVLLKEYSPTSINLVVTETGN